MPIYDVYRGRAFTSNKAYSRESLTYNLFYHLIVRRGYRHIGTCRADSKKDALRMVESTKYETPPSSYTPYLLGNLFPIKEPVPAQKYAEVMNFDRETIELHAKAFVMENYGDISELRRQQAAVFSYLVELISLQLSKAKKSDIQMLMTKFTGLTNVFNSSDAQSRMESTKTLQNAIRGLHSSNAVARNQTDLAMFLIFEFFERADMDELVRSQATVEFVMLIDKALTERIGRNNDFLSKSNVVL